MIIDARDIDDYSVLTADVAVVGAGPAGITIALELAASGYEVVLVESGREKLDPTIQQLAEAFLLDEELHAPLSIAVRRQLGGASIIWGGRCVPYDPVDLDNRLRVRGASWPVAYGDLLPFFQRACDWLNCGRAVFDAAETKHLPLSIIPGLPDCEVRTSTLERWSLPTDFSREYAAKLRESPRVRVITGLTCTRVVCHPEQTLVDHLQCRCLEQREIHIRAQRYVHCVRRARKHSPASGIARGQRTGAR